MAAPRNQGGANPEAQPEANTENVESQGEQDPQAAVQQAAEQERADLLAKLAAAEEREAKAAAKVAALEEEIARVSTGAPAPLSASGTITVNHKGEVVSS